MGRVWVLGLLISLALAAVMGAAAGCGGGSGSTGLTYCSSGCQTSWIGDGECDEACRTAACNWDGGDCAWVDACAVGCPDEWIGDGVCDDSCYNSACRWDGGDCDIPECDYGYSISVNNPLMCCPYEYPYYWYTDDMCHQAAWTAPTSTPAPECPSGYSIAINNPGKCCPSGYLYYWAGDGMCHAAASAAPTPTPAPACRDGYSPSVNDPGMCCPNAVPYYWSSDGMCHTVAPPAWRADIRSGDIVYDPNGALGLGHVGICYGTDYVIEAKKDSGVTKTPIEEWDNKQELYVLRVDCSDYTAAQAAELALGQVGKDYQGADLYLFPSWDLNSEMWYCSELVWAVYMNLGIDLEYTPGDLAVEPREIYMSTQVLYHLAFSSLQGLMSNYRGIKWRYCFQCSPKKLQRKGSI